MQETATSTDGGASENFHEVARIGCQRFVLAFFSFSIPDDRVSGTLREGL